MNYSINYQAMSVSELRAVLQDAEARGFGNTVIVVQNLAKGSWQQVHLAGMIDPTELPILPYRPQSSNHGSVIDEPPNPDLTNAFIISHWGA